MVYDRKRLKSESKKIIGAERFGILWKTLVYLLIILTISQLVSSLTGTDKYVENITEAASDYLDGVSNGLEGSELAALENAYNDAIFNSRPRTTFFASLIALLLNLATSVITAGFQWMCLLNTRHKPNDFRTIFDGFNFPFKIIGIAFLTGVLIVLGMILFVVPGIILAFAYSQSYYILFENPDKGIVQCMRESRQLMKGHKLDYFVLILSFIGWMIVGMFVTMSFSSILSIVGLSIIAGYAPVIFNTWLNTYQGLTYGGFYNCLVGWEPTEQPVIEEDNNSDYGF